MFTDHDLRIMQLEKEDYEEQYFLKAEFMKEPLRVSKEEFINAERNAGFRPKYGDGCATGGFSGGGVRGSIKRVKL